GGGREDGPGLRGVERCAQCHLDLALQDRERGAQLVRRVGAEVAGGGERTLETRQHLVQDGRQPAELVIPVLGGETVRKVLGADAAGGGGRGGRARAGGGARGRAPPPAGAAGGRAGAAPRGQSEATE